MSVHRAVALARLEAERGLHATYFVHLHSPFYSVLERPIRERIREIGSLGHGIGLHFEASFDGELADASMLEKRLRSEKDLLVDLAGFEVDVLSFHNPEFDGVLQFDADRYAGMMNAYGQDLRRRYGYVSDSNGYWRFQPLRSALLEAAGPLHVLTHPEWWTPDPMSPRDRVARCLDGRARSAGEQYDDALRRGGRLNVT